MTGDSDSLEVREFSPEDQTLLTDFSCGDDEWSEYISQWIRGEEVLHSMEKGTRVWLFQKRDGEIVGYGSLGPARWRWPPPLGPYENALIVPALGVATRFHGMPPDPERRYAIQIISHLIAEAKALADATPIDSSERPRRLVLLVHRDNRRAQRFYEKVGFEAIRDVERRKNHIIMHLVFDDVEIVAE